VRRLTISVLFAALMLAGNGTASARPSEPLVEGRGSVLNAGMYERVLGNSRAPIQILDRLCPKPGRDPGCAPVTNALRRAIEDAVAVHIRWVHHEHRHGGKFWELTPVVRNRARAYFEYRWDEPGPLGCYGQGTVRFHRVDWTGWEERRGFGLIGCAVAGVHRTA
jgi:hypothetical protein